MELLRGGASWEVVMSSEVLPPAWINVVLRDPDQDQVSIGKESLTLSLSCFLASCVSFLA